MIKSQRNHIKPCPHTLVIWLTGKNLSRWASRCRNRPFSLSLGSKTLQSATGFVRLQSNSLSQWSRFPF